MFRRALRLSSDSTTVQGAVSVSVAASMASLAFEYSSQRLIDSRSMGESFQRLSGFSRRARKRRSCSSGLTENQYLRSRMPSSISMSSKTGHWRRKRSYSCGVQKPMTCSTPARLYQERSSRTISPAAGRCAT